MITSVRPDVPPLIPNLFELLPPYVQVFLLVTSLVILFLGGRFMVRVARSAFGLGRRPDPPAGSGPQADATDPPARA